MLLLTSTSDVIRVITGSAANNVEVHASWVDMNGATITPGRQNTSITTATTTTVVPSPGASTHRNVRALYITNKSTISCEVAVEHYDGTTAIEMYGVVLLPNENMTFNEEGKWTHRDANGAEYPAAGLGAWNGRSIPFMKSGTASDAAGYWYCTSKDSGFPGAWSPGTPGVNGRACSGFTGLDAGAIPIVNPSVGANYLTELLMSSTIAQYHLFFDVLWVNTGLSITTTTAQAITTPTLPARDINGSTNGEGCMIGVLCTSAVGLAAIASNATVDYTNSDGTAGRTATLSPLIGSQAPATPVIGTLIWFNLAAGDKGVRSIQGITLNTSWVSGTISLLIARDVASIGTLAANVPNFRALAAPGARLYNDSTILHCMQTSNTTATFCNGELTVMER